MKPRLAPCVALALAFVVGSCSNESPTAPTAAQVGGTAAAHVPLVRVSEIHYDNTGTDAGESIEVSGPAGTDLTGWQLVLYNGSSASLATYGTRTLAGVLPTTCGERGLHVETYPSNGIQNGNPDGIALVDASGAVVEFLSYGGTFTAANGPAAGMLSVDIGVTQSTSTPVGQSLQRAPNGDWAGNAASTFGACNDGTTNTPPDHEDPEDPEDPDPPAGVPVTRFSEIHYDNAGADVNEAIEIEGPAGTNVTGWSIALYNATGGALYNTTTLAGVLPNQCAGRGTLVVRYPADGLQNGSSDGFALVNASGEVVEFLSYEGTLTATDGPAAGMTSVAIPTFEQSTSPVGNSLQRRPDGLSWGLSAPNSFGNCYGQPPVEASNSIAFSGRTPFDPALPVGFEDQIFATLRSGAGATLETTFTWTSETPAIASVDAAGVMRALAVGTAIIRATAVDGTTSTWSLPTRLAVAGATAQYANNAEFGEPTDADASDDFIVRRDQFTSSYSRVRNTPNWVSYNLDATHIGAEDRCDCFTFDPALPGDYARYTTADYTGAGAIAGYGIDRGHLARSFDRTTGSLDNATTFYFSNIIPQAADNNQGPWAILENHLGDLARFNDREVHIIAGVAGNKGTVKNEGRIVIPAATWKVAVVMPRNTGIGQVNTWQDVQVIAVIMPNDAGIRNVAWQTYQVTVDEVEALSGYDLLALLRDDIEVAVESGTEPPMAAVNGPYSGFALDPVAMSAAASTDGDGDALTYAWDFGDGETGAGVSVTHTYDAPGSYTVRLIVTDVLGLADTVSTTATMSPMPASEGIRRLQRLLDDLSGSGVLRGGEANALSAKLDAESKQLDRGHTTPMNGQLGALRNQVNAMVASGRLTPAQAAPLLAMIGRTLDAMGN